MTPHEYCRTTLKKVSRTFALNIALLNGDLYKSILCAYLFCRIADTIEDTVFEDTADQKRLLAEFGNIFDSADFSPERIEIWKVAFASAKKVDAGLNEDQKLVLHTELVVTNFLSLPRSYRKVINRCLVEMCSGMLETIEMKDRRSRLYFSRTIEDLNRYCYYVAGTVGVLLTRLFFVHSRSITRPVLRNLGQRAVSFGLGLQITNIIKDCWTDHKRGWCYIPEELTRKNGLVPEAFFEPQNRNKAQKTLNDLILRAAGHLDDALLYTLQIPRRNVRIRLFCLLPLFFAINTLVEAKDNFNLLNGSKVKISRSMVKKLTRTAALFCLSNHALERYYRRFRLQLEDAVEAAHP